MTIKLQKNPTLENVQSPYLPKNYNFELTKTINTILKNNYKRVALQMPDGILKYSSIISDLIKTHTNAETIIFGDVVYGACCIDDNRAYTLGCDLLIHYGHSCLVPVTECRIKILYVFVDIIFESGHLFKCVYKILDEVKDKDKCADNFDFAIFGTIQFNRLVREVERKFGFTAYHNKPLSKGEVLGCTAPRIKNKYVIFISDGRFHLEALMIANPDCQFFRYCPFSKKVFREFYDNKRMLDIRRSEVLKFKECRNIGIILGTLGKQGNPVILENLRKRLSDKKLYIFVFEEIKRLDHCFIDGYVQICCPRLSIDWGLEFRKPVLSPFEVFWSFDEYKMDFYSYDGKNEWQNYQKN